VRQLRHIALAIIAVSVTGSNAAAAEPAVTDGIVSAPIGEVWRLLTGSSSARSNGAVAIGATMRARLRPAGELDETNTLVSEILAYEPERMLATRIVEAPADFAFPNAVGHTWSVLYLYPLGEAMTHVRLVELGYRDDAESLALREFVLARNRERFDRLIAQYAARCARCEAEAAADSEPR
jgi:hypothetical protein